MSNLGRWEYTAVQVEHEPRHREVICGVRVDRFDAAEAVLDDLADTGWEVVGMYSPATWRCRLRRRVTARG